MDQASAFVAAYDSEDDDYVSMDEQEMIGGIQQLFIANNDEDNDDEEDEEENEATNFISSMNISAVADISTIASSNSIPDISNLPQLRENENNANRVSIRDRISRGLTSKMNKIRGKNNTRKSAAVHKRLARKKVNTNVVSLDLATLGNEANEVATGDAYICTNKLCRVSLSMHDTLQSSTAIMTAESKANDDEDTKIWKCQFCQTLNTIDIEDEEIPKCEIIDYILEPAVDDLKSEDENYIIFCIDISGSMCVTQEAGGKFNLRGSQMQKMKSDMLAFGDGSNQYLPKQKKNTTWISRLQSVQASIDEQLNILQKSHPNNKICLVSFANDVTIIGDGRSAPEFIVGDKLLNMEKLKEIGSNYRLEQPISVTREQLSNKLFELKEGGLTALGPALVVSIAIAARKSGSQVILCTDGLANVGLGSLDYDDSDHIEDEQEDARELQLAEWYEQLGNWALINGINVNVISITDDQCQLELLGKVADISQGNVDRINPLDLTNNFSSILARACLATNVQARMLLPPMLKFKIDDDEDIAHFHRKSSVRNVNNKQMMSSMMNTDIIIEENEVLDNNTNNNNNNIDSKAVEISSQIQDIGNVFSDTKLFFEYIVDKQLLRQPKYESLKEIPFQVQIYYSRLNGSKMLRVITQLKPITKDRKKVIRNLNMNIIGANASRKCARLAEDGNYEAARAVTYSQAMWMSSNSHQPLQQQQMVSYVQQNLAFDGMMQQQQMSENHSMQYASKKQKKSKRKKKRKDHFSKAMYSHKHSKY